MQSGAGYKIVKVAGGVHSVHSLAERETFHPVIGPVAEAEALYVRQIRLLERLHCHTGEFVIWDVCLGSAANALTVLRAAAQTPCPIHLVSFDHTIAPLEFALQHVDSLGYLAGFEDRLCSLMRDHRVQYSQLQQEVVWELHLGDFPSLLTRPIARQLPKPHAIMFDAFSPARNPAMWTLPLFKNLFDLLIPERPCALPTYSRSTMLRVTLLLAGFFVGVGHATGEKEETTIAANTPELITEPLDQSWLQRVRRSTSAEPMRQPVYQQAPLATTTWEALQRHPQFC